MVIKRLTETKVESKEESVALAGVRKEERSLTKSTLELCWPLGVCWV